MAMEGLVVLCLVTVVSAQMLVAVAGGRPPAIFVLGDSTLDVGNNNHLPGADVPRANRPYYDSLADNFGLTKDTFADPGASGYTDIAGPCCGSGRLLAEADCLPSSTVCTGHDQHVFWDRFHPSQRACFLTAQAFYNGPAQYTTPINFMQLAQS